MDRAQKEQLVSSLNGALSQANAVVIAHYRGLNASQTGELRRRVKEAGASFKVTKNRLARFALKGTPYEALSDMFTGPTAVTYSVDPVAAAKVTVDFAKTTDKLVVIGGALGERVLDENEVKALASMPSLDELRGKIVGLVQAPAQRLAMIVQAPAGQLARVVGAYAKKDEAA